MASIYEIEVMLSSAKDLKNVNWRYGPIRPYIVVWVDPTQKHSTGVAQSGDLVAVWDEKLTIQVPSMTTIDNTTLYIDVVHTNTEPNGMTLMIGSARLRLIEVGVGECDSRTLSLMRPSGRPQGTLEVKVVVKVMDYRAPRGAYDSPAYGVPPAPTPAPTSTGYNAPPPANVLGVPMPTHYNAQPNYYGYSQVGEGSNGYVQEILGYEQSGRPSHSYGQTIFSYQPVITGPGLIRFGSGAVNFGLGSHVSFCCGGARTVVNVLETNGRRSNHRLGTGLHVGGATRGIGDRIADHVASEVERNINDDN